MRNSKLILLVICLMAGVTIMFSCKSEPKEPLDEAKAQQTIKQYILNHGFEHGTEELIIANSIQKYDKATQGADHQTSIKAYFKNEAGTNTVVLVFNFTNPSKDQWVLHSIKSEGKVSNDLADWVARKTGLNEPVK
ncbi:MAG TPA: hypothetical protein VFG10_15260 [Saprospiraceae bacterium]|nr:hypothetical protein [Saprospiraceae bacterium]